MVIDGGVTIGMATASERTFRAMNADVHIIVNGGPAGLADDAESTIHRLEQLWSRFRPDSDIGRINAAGGRPVVVAPETFDLVAAAVAACDATDGIFDPTVERTMRAAGYDRTFDDLRGERPSIDLPSAGVDRIELHAMTSAVVVPPGVGLDLGGIGKGAAADLVAELLMSGGAGGCSVNVGGDVRVAGTAPGDVAWTIGLEIAEPTTPRVTLRGGAVCTSATTRRAWNTARGRQHHLRHPRTGAQLDSGLAAVTIVAAKAAQAEVLAKVALAGGLKAADESARSTGSTGVVVTDTHEVVALHGLDAFLPVGAAS